MNKDLVWKWFRRIGNWEAASFILLLGIAMPLKYLAGIPQAVSVVGMAHGVLFIAYLYMVHECRMQFKWPFWVAALGALASVAPLGPYIFDKWLHKKQYVPQ